MSYEVCEHGQMKRKCDICSLRADVKELEAERDRYRELVSIIEVQAVNSIEPGWVMIPAVEWSQAWERFHRCA